MNLLTLPELSATCLRTDKTGGICLATRLVIVIHQWTCQSLAFQFVRHFAHICMSQHALQSAMLTPRRSYLRSCCTQGNDMHQETSTVNQIGLWLQPMYQKWRAGEEGDKRIRAGRQPCVFCLQHACNVPLNAVAIECGLLWWYRRSGAGPVMVMFAGRAGGASRRLQAVLGCQLALTCPYPWL